FPLVLPSRTLHHPTYFGSSTKSSRTLATNAWLMILVIDIICYSRSRLEFPSSHVPTHSFLCYCAAYCLATCYCATHSFKGLHHLSPTTMSSHSSTLGSSRHVLQ